MKALGNPVSPFNHVIVTQDRITRLIHSDLDVRISGRLPRIVAFRWAIAHRTPWGPAMKPFGSKLRLSGEDIRWDLCRDVTAYLRRKNARYPDSLRSSMESLYRVINRAVWLEISS